MTYDSREDTLNHIEEVRCNIDDILMNLHLRSHRHDRSKLESPEKEVFDEVTPKLKELEYNSPEYKAQLAEMGIALDHHYRYNSHHPQHFPNGVEGMNLLDQLEMLADWYAATKRMKNGSLRISIEQNAERFGYNIIFRDQLIATAEELGWL